MCEKWAKQKMEAPVLFLFGKSVCLILFGRLLLFLLVRLFNLVDGLRFSFLDFPIDLYVPCSFHIKKNCLLDA